MSTRSRKSIMKSDPQMLTTAERIAVEGLMARELRVRQEYAKLIEPLQQDYGVLFASICERIGLPVDALATTHEIDAQTMTIRERASNIVPLPSAEDETS